MGGKKRVHPLSNTVVGFNLRYDARNEPDGGWIADAVQPGGGPARGATGHIIHGHGACPEDAIYYAVQEAQLAGWKIAWPEDQTSAV